MSGLGVLLKYPGKCVAVEEVLFPAQRTVEFKSCQNLLNC